MENEDIRVRNVSGRFHNKYKVTLSYKAVNQIQKLSAQNKELNEDVIGGFIAKAIEHYLIENELDS